MGRSKELAWHAWFTACRAHDGSNELDMQATASLTQFRLSNQIGFDASHLGTTYIHKIHLQRAKGLSVRACWLPGKACRAGETVTRVSADTEAGALGLKGSSLDSSEAPCPRAHLGAAIAVPTFALLK